MSAGSLHMFWGVGMLRFDGDWGDKRLDGLGIQLDINAKQNVVVKEDHLNQIALGVEEKVAVVYQTCIHHRDTWVQLIKNHGSQ